jgi:hypothetical protein
MKNRKRGLRRDLDYEYKLEPAEPTMHRVAQTPASQGLRFFLTESWLQKAAYLRKAQVSATLAFNESVFGRFEAESLELFGQSEGDAGVR